MDDFTVSSLHESKNEWCARLLTILTPCIISGFNSIFHESWKLCSENDEEDKYLMTFQNLITQVPKWSNATVDEEVRRIVENSGCNYISDLITCVHIIHLKLLTSVRVGSQQKKIDINIPEVNIFIHNCYIQSARKIYTNVYLFDKFATSLQKQKNNRELEIIVQECILTTIRDSLPIEHILKSYIDETVEEDVIETVLEEKIEKKPEEDESSKVEETKEKQEKEDKEQTQDNATTEKTENNSEDNENVFLKINTTDSEKSNESSDESALIKFNDTDSILNSEDKEEKIEAPKDVDFLEELNKKRELESSFNDDDDEDENERLTISDDVPLNLLDIENIGEPDRDSDNIQLNDVEILN